MTKIFSKKVFVFLVFSLCFVSGLNAQSSNEDGSYKHKKNKSYCFENKRHWLPHWTSINNFQAKKSWFFQTNIGVGFLYFDKVRGNLEGAPRQNFADTNFGGSSYIKHGLTYNRTPLYEYTLGNRVFNWLKFALSYQYQGQVNIETQTLPTLGSLNPVIKQFTSNWSVNAIMAKIYFESPLPLVWFNAAFSPYLALAVGPSWQTWTRVSISSNTVLNAGLFEGRDITINMKVIPNCSWGVDAGFRMQNAKRALNNSIVIGCKYNQWGQARNIGKMSQQPTYKISMAKPFKIRTVYSFAPYLGVQWNFSTNMYRYGKETINNPLHLKRIYVSHLRDLERKNSFSTQFNAGPCFLYFDKVRYQLDLVPQSITSNYRTQGKLKYNRVPLFEWFLGYNIVTCFKAGISYQYLNSVELSTGYQSGEAAVNNSNAKARFITNVMVNTLMAKFNFDWPLPLVWANFSINPYLAVGVGSAWQTFNNTYVHYSLTDSSSNILTEILPLKNKTMASLAYMVDMGFRLHGIYPTQVFSTLFGCKYNQFGQIRNVGLQRQQSSTAFAISKPFSVKTVYSFAPYMGVQWNFASSCQCNAPLKIQNKNLNTWKPFWTNVKHLNPKLGFWTQFNVGVGFIYFDKVSGNIMGEPAVDFNGATTSVPLKGGLQYNKSPLFEYQIGYSYLSWFQSSLSYQVQNNVMITSKHLHGVGASNTSLNQFVATLALNAVTMKFYFELPYPLVWKNLALTPYLALGVGPSWQSWTNISINRSRFPAATYFAQMQAINKKISASCAWLVDAGVKSLVACPQAKFSTYMGCKYNQWGQARSMGKITQQNTQRVGLFKPVKIRTIYSFAPYIGFQWNF